MASGGLCFSGEKSVCPPALDQLIPDTNTTGTNHSSKGHPYHDTTAGLPVLLLGLVLVVPSVFVSCCIGKESSHRDTEVPVRFALHVSVGRPHVANGSATFFD